MLTRRLLKMTLFALVPCLVFSQVDLNNGLVAYYPFNGNANDASGNGNNPIFNNATLTSDYYGKPNGAYHFNGVDNYMEIANSASLNSNSTISICAWIKPTGFYYGSCHGNSVVMKGNADFQSGNYMIRYDDALYTGKNCNGGLPDTLHETYYAIGTGLSPVQDTPYAQKNVWRSVVYTYDGSHARLYIDCNLILDSEQPGLNFSNNTDLFLGRLNDSQYPYWLNGDLDEVRIYNRALNADEVKAYAFSCADKIPCGNWAKINQEISGIQIGDLDVYGNQLTVEALINRNQPYNDLYNGGDVVSKHDNPSDDNYLLRPNIAEIETSNGFFTTTKVCEIELNKTYHIAMVYDGKKLKFYRDGLLLSEVAATGNLIQNNWLTKIGTTANTASPYPADFLGYINEVRIWNVARTQNQIRAYMNQPLLNPASKQGLLAYYTFDNLKNKQGNSQWDGSVIGNATINQTNPNCALSNDSCNTILQKNVTASFASQDSVCAGKSVSFVNTSQNASNYYWSFCSSLKTTPTAINLGNPGNQLGQPVFSDFGLDDNGNYYSIVSNHTPGKITRLNFGTSLLNTPTVDDLGNFNGIVGNQTEGIQVLKVNGNWYAIIVGGGNFGTNSSPRIVKLDFGNSLSNIPTATNWGNIGSLDLPIDFEILQENGNYYGFTMNVNSNTITRFDFGTDFTNPPTGTNLGNIGNLDYPDGFKFVKNNSNWYAFVVNAFSNTITRLNFGSSLINTPIPVIIANPSNLLNQPRDISLLIACDGIFGYVINAVTNDMTKLNFGNNITATPTANSLGNIGGFNVPHSFSDFFTSGNSIYSFIPNAFNNTLTRIKFNACQDIPSSTQQTPGPVTFTDPGSYTANLLVDIGLPTQTSFCKQIVVKDCTPPVTASFTSPDTVCINENVNVTNTSTNASNYTWSFCSSFKTTPSAFNLGSNLQLNTPVFVDYGLDNNGNYYGIATNHIPGKITRLNFGKSLLNTPTAEDLGNFNDILPAQLEGVQILNLNGHWYAIAVGGGNQLNNSSPRIVKLDFGNSLTNTPVATNWGNIGSLDLPIDFQIIHENGKYYGFAMNVLSNTITRFDFGTDFANAPTAVNLGNIGNLSYPDGFTFVKYNNSWYAFVVNTYSNEITRLSFGSSLTSTPTATQITNPGNTLNAPRDITLLFTCNGIYGYVVNANSSNIIKLNFGNDIKSIPSAVDLGNLGNLNFPHSFSNFFSVGSDVYTFIPNVDNNSITRIKFAGCQSMPGSNKKTPDPLSYDSAGVYTISLLVDVGLPTQTSFCKQIVVKNCGCDSFKVNAGKDKSICYGTSVQLNAANAAFYRWNASPDLSDTTIANPIARPLKTTQFIVTGYSSDSSCTNKDTVKITILSLPVFSVNNDTSVCSTSHIPLNANGKGNYDYVWTPSKYLSDSAIANPVSIPADSIKYFATAIDSNNCRATDSVQINVVQTPILSTINNSRICFGDSILLATTATNATKFVWGPSSGLNNTSIESPEASPENSTVYTVIASNVLCSAKDSVKITILSLPKVSAGSDTIICTEGAAHLHSSGAITYNWSPIQTLSNPNISNPVAVPAITTTYHVTGTDNNNCINTDSVIVYKQDDPIFTVNPVDSIICSGQTISLVAAGGDTYTWSPSQSVSNPASATTSTHPAASTQYSVAIYDSTCRVSKTLTSKINVQPSPVVTVSKSNDIDCSNPQAQLHATGGISYTWMPNTYIDSTKITNPIVTPPSDVLYIVTATAQNGCTATDSILVKSTLGNMELYVASAFTPNGDGLNDCFGLRYWGTPSTFDMMIYDKWGVPVYHSRNINECWDGTYKGKKQASGTYVYMISATNACGQQKIFRKGTVVLIR